MNANNSAQTLYMNKKTVKANVKKLTCLLGGNILYKVTYGSPFIQFYDVYIKKAFSLRRLYIGFYTILGVFQ